jgi:hypothetical protein
MYDYCEANLCIDHVSRLNAGVLMSCSAFFYKSIMKISAGGICCGWVSLAPPISCKTAQGIAIYSPESPEWPPGWYQKFVPAFSTWQTKRFSQ